MSPWRLCKTFKHWPHLRSTSSKSSRYHHSQVKSSAQSKNVLPLRGPGLTLPLRSLPRCQETMLVDRAQYLQQSIVTCPRQTCNHRWCKSCFKDMTFAAPGSANARHKCKPEKTVGVRACPGKAIFLFSKPTLRHELTNPGFQNVGTKAGGSRAITLYPVGESGVGCKLHLCDSAF